MEEVFKDIIESGLGIDSDDVNDGDGCGVLFCEFNFHCFRPSMLLISTEQTWKKHRRRDCQRRGTRR